MAVFVILCYLLTIFFAPEWRIIPNFAAFFYYYGE